MSVCPAQSTMYAQLASLTIISKMENASQSALKATMLKQTRWNVFPLLSANQSTEWTIPTFAKVIVLLELSKIIKFIDAMHAKLNASLALHGLIACHVRIQPASCTKTTVIYSVNAMTQMLMEFFRETTVLTTELALVVVLMGHTCSWSSAKIAQAPAKLALAIKTTALVVQMECIYRTVLVLVHAQADTNR